MAENKPSNRILQIIKKYQEDRPVSAENKDILSKAIAEIDQESLIKGVIYSEIFGQPKCRRRGR